MITSTLIPRSILVALFWVSLSSLPASAQADDVFGTRQRLGSALVGIFYDLKQTQQRVPVPNHAGNYPRALDEFLISGFDEALINRYFRAALPLYTTQLSIRRMSAGAAPKAFGVEDVVAPSYWIIHYKGQVAPPADGTYRFVGNFDDVLIVAVNRRIVLNGSRADTKLPLIKWTEPADKGPRVAANGLSAYGDWVELKAGQPVDIDIIIGERPGGSFYGVLLYQKKGETYPLNAQGHIILPLFQTAPNPDSNPNYLTDQAPWRALE